MARTLTDDDVTALAEAIARCPVLPIIAATVADLRVMLRCPSKWATHQEIRRLNLKPYARGKYRLRDVENAVARASHNATRRAGAKP